MLINVTIITIESTLPNKDNIKVYMLRKLRIKILQNMIVLGCVMYNLRNPAIDPFAFFVSTENNYRLRFCL